MISGNGVRPLSILLVLLLTLVGCGGEDESDTPGCNIDFVGVPADPSRVVVFVGDSVTARWHLPCRYVNAGVDGQSSAAILERFDRDILSHRPSIVVILAGTNDLLTQPRPSVDSIERMAELAREYGACVVLGTVPPIENPPYDIAAIGINLQSQMEDRLAAFNSDIVYLALSRGFLYADYQAAMLNRLGTQNKILFNRDGVHPNSAGHDVMLRVVLPLLQQCP